jgi:hypothetical protein
MNPRKDGRHRVTVIGWRRRRTALPIRTEWQCCILETTLLCVLRERMERQSLCALTFNTER